MPIISKADATAEEINKYYETLAETMFGVHESIHLLNAIKAVTGDPDENRRLGVKLLDLAAESSKLQAKMLAFSAASAVFSPPSEEQLLTIKEIVRDLDRMIASASKASEVIGLATDLVNKFNDLAG